MRKNNSKMNKVLKVTYNTWYEIVVGFAKEFNKEYYEIENVLVSILSKDNINKIKRNTKYEENILEIANEPNDKCTTLYNIHAFINQYGKEIEDYYKRCGLMRA